MKIKYDINLMKYISLFETITGAKVKDCFTDDFGQLFFIVYEGEIGKAVGKRGINIKKIEGVLKKKFRVVEFSDDLIKFVKSLVYPLQLKTVEEIDGVLQIKDLDTKTKALLIGRNAINIKNYEGIIKRYFDIVGIKVI
jgi:N utilization substance protein A